MNDAFIIKIDPSKALAASLLYSTYLGGSGTEQGNRIAVDTTGKILVSSETYSANFPTKSPKQTSAAACQGRAIGAKGDRYHPVGVQQGL